MSKSVFIIFFLCDKKCVTTRYEYALLRDFFGDLSERLSRKYYAVPFFTKANLNIHMKSARISSVAVLHREDVAFEKASSYF